MEKQQITRRTFLEQTAGGLATALAPPPTAPRGTATDPVVLGRSGVRVSRLGFGTGSNGGSVQRALGQEGFNRLVRYALDQGITFFDTADNYGEMHERLRAALRGVDRGTIQIQTKFPWDRLDDPLAALDRYRREVGTDYFDSVLLHCTRSATWPDDLQRMMDALAEAKARGVVRSHGVSMHGLAPLEATTRTGWPDVAQVRVNHNGHHMDGPTGDWQEPGDRDAALPHIRRLHEAGMGVIGMKLVGNGDFTDPAVRRRALHYVMRLPYVDAVVLGFKSPAEIDEALRNMNEGLGG